MHRRTLLISDIDGTLLSGREPVPKSVIDAAQAFMDRGNLLSFCTGRSLSSAREVYSMLPVNAPSILFGGALLYDFTNAEILSAHYLPPSLPNLIESILSYDSGISVAVSGVEQTWVLRSNEVFEQKALAHDRDGIRTDTLPDSQLLKVLLTSEDPQTLNRMKEHCIPEGLYHAQFASSHFFEIVSITTSKGHAVAELLSLIPGRVRTCGAGDSITDLSLAAAVEAFYAPEDAHTAVLEHARGTFPPAREGGIAQLFGELT